MKALIIQIIFILCELAVAAPFVFYVEKLRKDHEKWRRWLSSEIYKAKEEGRDRDAEKLQNTAWRAAATDFGLPWYAKGFRPMIILFVLGFIVYEAFSYVGLSQYIWVDSSYDNYR